MKKLVVTGLALLAAACGSDKGERPIQYGAPQPSTAIEDSAAASAQTALSAGFTASTQPTYGSPGLADQLARSLGVYFIATAAPTPQSAKLVGRAVSQAIDTGGLNPACVTIDETLGGTTVTWRCLIEITDTDPYSGATTYLKVTIDGTLTWDAGTGRTTWDIDETMLLTDSQSMERTDASADLSGSMTVTPTTIVADAVSYFSYQLVMPGVPLPLAFGTTTTLALDVGYQADPFCITSGTLVLENRWTPRPLGATEASLPNQGWVFDWKGCNAFEVSHGN